jgi:Fic family protein
MRDKKRVVLPSCREHNKPVAPPDFWEQVDALRPKTTQRPEGGFTLIEFQRKFDLSESKARRQLAKMVNEGKLVKQGVYYLVPNANL